jgi:hypothetical protein
MLKMDKCWRWRGVLLLAGLLLLVPTHGFATTIQTTNVQGIVYRADGSLAQGTMLVSWPSFTAADGSAVAAGNTSVTIAADGSVSMALAPNVGANPQGTYYTVVYHLNDGTVQKEYWVVPQAATATISEMRARVVPAAVAQQSVTQQYVDASISAVQANYLQLKGGTMSGALNLSSDPMNAMQAVTKEYVDAHSGAQLPQSQSVIAGSGNGGAVAMMEKGVSITGANGNVAWDDDLNAGIYDPRDPRWGAQDTPVHQAAAIQAMSNQMACDMAMGKVAQAVAKFPQGSFAVDELQMAPGSSWEGTAQADGGTFLHSIYNNHPLATAPATMTLTCSDGNSHTDSVGLTHVSHFTLAGCAQGGCSNAPGDTASYLVAGPYNTGLEFISNGIIEHIFAEAFGGYGIRVDGQDQKVFHIRVAANDEWYYYGGYKGVTESATSAEVNAATTGATGSVALSWPAVSGATGYVIYRGTTAGGESVFYLSATNSFTDTGAAGTSNPVTNTVTNALAAPSTITATPSTTGGTLAAATYYYKITATVADGWHGSIECCGLDGMADWIEAYGLFDSASTFSYHHLADILGGGGNSHFDHLWPQLGQVGIAQPYGYGAGDQYENIRIDFARLEGFWSTDVAVAVRGGMIDGSCTSSNAATLNTGQIQTSFAGTCDQFFSTGQGTILEGVAFSDNAGYGPTYKTADILNQAGTTTNVRGAYQWIPISGILAGLVWSPQSSVLTGVTVGTGEVINMAGLSNVNPNDTAAATLYAFQNVQNGQDFYVKGGNSHVTVKYNPPWIVTCSGQNINLGNVTGFLHFNVVSSYGALQTNSNVSEVCNSRTAANTVASSETVTYSATPIFSMTTRTSIITLTGSVTSFSLTAGADGQEKTLTFCQNATGGFTVTGPSNVHGLFTVGSTASKCSSQHFTYSVAQSAWLADSPGVTNE